MTLVYSSNKTKINGVHCNPVFFKDVNNKASLVYADDKEIGKQYLDVGIKVLPLSPAKAKKKEKGKE